ncbi:hypothetical protein TNCV_220191 [Trichonephila clavipes]|nr:hypothetical protein TNCV_220191 [Trichonephila clavipes]
MPKQCVGYSKLQGPSFPGTRVYTHGKYMGDSSAIEAKSIRVAQASEAEPSLPELQRREEREGRRGIEKRDGKERSLGHLGIVTPVLI